MRYLTKRRTLLLACILSLTAGTYLTIYYLAGNPKPNDVLESDKKPPAVNASGTSRSSVQTSLQQSPVKLLETSKQSISPPISLGLFQKLSSGGGGPQTLFCSVGGGCFVDSVSEGWGVGSNLSWGSRHI